MNRYIALLLLVFTPFAFGECPSAIPKETLECYFNAVDSKNEQAIKIVYLGLTNYHFGETNPPKREILKQAALNQNLVVQQPNNAVPIWALKGNIEFTVREIYTSHTLVVSFFLNQKEGKWYLVGHSAHGQAI